MYNDELSSSWTPEIYRHGATLTLKLPSTLNYVISCMHCYVISCLMIMITYSKNLSGLIKF